MGIRDLSPTDLVERALTGDRRAIGRVLTLIERGGPPSDEITDLTHPAARGAHVVGITGAPGAGKSTLTGQLIRHLPTRGRKPAVLAVDPSSPLTGGAILGDRVRMDDVAGDGGFIRSVATRGHAGGLALSVPGCVRAFDACGFDPVLIETVGVGQVEVDVAGAADTTVVVVNPGWGDAVQANKAGLLEVADVFVINKADRDGANDTRRDLELMLDLSHVSGQEDESGYRPPIIMTTATDANVACISVLGSFDDCQAMAKAAFADADLRARRPLASANSINVGRLLPQVFYYFFATAQVDPADHRPLVFSTPSGNFGNLTAGLIAKRLGLPAEGFVAAQRFELSPTQMMDGDAQRICVLHDRGRQTSMSSSFRRARSRINPRTTACRRCSLMRAHTRICAAKHLYHMCGFTPVPLLATAALERLPTAQSASCARCGSSMQCRRLWRRVPPCTFQRAGYRPQWSTRFVPRTCAQSNCGWTWTRRIWAHAIAS